MSEIYDDLGERIRSIRIELGITVNALAEKTGFTPSFISQFERGLTQGSLGAIHKITNALGIRVSSLFAQIEDNQQEKVSVVRKDKRPQVRYPDGQTTDYILSDSSDKLKAYYTEIAPFGKSGEAYFSFYKIESITILEGQLEMKFDEDVYTLNVGDTISYPSSRLRTWRNLSDKTTKVYWVFVP